MEQKFDLQSISISAYDTIILHLSQDFDIETANILFKEVKKTFPQNKVLAATDVLKGMTILKSEATNFLGDVVNEDNWESYAYPSYI